MSTAPILIIGAGPLGLASAIALTLRGQRVRLVDARPAAAGFDDKRILALSHGSRQLLENLGAWPAGVTPIETIHISQRGALGRTLIKASEHRLPALGYVLPATLLQAALLQRAQSLGIAIDYDSHVSSWQAGADHISVAIEQAGSARSGAALLVICCEGTIAADAPEVVSRDYDQLALLARVTPSATHRNTAWERFTPDGPIALLPLEKDYALVWTIAPNKLPTLMAKSDTDFLAALQAAFGSRVSLQAVSARTSYPLSLRYRRKPVGQRLVWLGNAAQTLHPVAGQGFNLALRDAWELADSLCGAPDAGAASALSAYATRRRSDRLQTIGFTDFLVRVFSNSNPLLRHARSAGLLALDLCPPARRLVAHKMLFGSRT